MSGEANAYLAELRAERDRLREVVRRVEEIVDEVEDDESIGIPPHVPLLIQAFREALRSTDTGPAPAGAYAATQGAGDVCGDRCAGGGGLCG